MGAKKLEDLPILRTSQLKLIERGVDLRDSSIPGGEEICFLAREFVQVTLPHAAPRGNPPFWSRTNGNLILTVRPGLAGYPFGTIPRLLIAWMNTEIKRTKQRRLDLGDSLNDFMREIGLDPATGGGPRSDRKRIRMQMERLFRSTISFDHAGTAGNRWLDMPITTRGFMWWDSAMPDQVTLFPSWIEVSESFFDLCMKSVVPADLRALRALKGSALMLDIYFWLNYKTYQAAKRGDPIRVSWAQIKDQLGAEYGDLRNFQQKAGRAVEQVKLVLPGANVSKVRGGLEIHPGQTAIPARTV